MGKHKFDCPEKDGKPSVLFKPVETKRSKLSKKEKKTAISQLADVEQVTINGKVMEEDQIPAYVLDQIRGRGDLVYNQMYENEEVEEEEGDLYDLQDAPGDEEYEEYEDYDFQAEGIKEEDKEGSQGEWEDEDDGQDSGDDGIEVTVEDEEKPKELKFKPKMEEFPTLEEVFTVNIEGKEYKLTQKQIQMLETVIPENYESMDFGGLDFKRYNEDGLLIADKDKYQKYMLKQNDKVVVVDTYECAPSKPMDFFDNDLKPEQIRGNVNIKEVQEALNYDGEEQIYEQLEDDFFSKMIQGQLEEQHPKQVKKGKQVKQGKETKQPKEQKKANHNTDEVVPKISENELEQKLKKAMFNFQHNIEQKNEKKALTDSEDSEEEPDSKNNHTTSLNFQELEKKEEYVGKDGEMDWRCLTKQEKKVYMKTKIIREFYDQLREREVEEKMRGKNNVDVKDLHLKQHVEHIPFEEDHVMKKALEDGLNEDADLNEEESLESISDDDDIVSFHQKSSIIATNLSVIQEPKKPRKQKKQQRLNEEANITLTKAIPEQRNRNQTSQQRKQRKKKHKDMKKEKREQKKEFAQRFGKMQREAMKKENPNNPLNKVSYVKIY